MSLPSKKAIQVDENITDYEYRMLNLDMILRYDESKCLEREFHGFEKLFSATLHKILKNKLEKNYL